MGTTAGLASASLTVHLPTFDDQAAEVHMNNLTLHLHHATSTLEPVLILCIYV